MERSTFSLRELKFDAASSADEEMLFSGYGAVFGNVDAYGDVIVPGAFADTLASAQQTGVWPSMLMQHGGGMLGGSAEDMTPVGIWTALSEDGVGLKVEGKLANTPKGRDVYTLLKMQPRPAITGLSIGYMAKESSPRTKPEEPRRTLKKIELFEVSLVTFPANGKARVNSVKSLDNILSLSDAEAFLREVGGFSKSQATAFIARVKAAGRGDPGEAEELREIEALLRKRQQRLFGQA